MKYYIYILILLMIPQYSYPATLVSQHGITWTFADDETCGQFINGDYWCVGPVSITNISPGYVSYPRGMNGSMVNPHALPHGYDSNNNYSASVNVGIGISAGTPLVLTSNTSLVSTISNETLGGVRNDQSINTAAVLTILGSSPPTGSFRPGVSSSTKTLHNINDVNRSRLLSLALPVGLDRPSISTYANHFQMAWLTHDHSAWVEMIHPTASGLDDYYFAAKFAEAALILNLDYTLEQKETLLINFIQLGIDIYSYIESGGKGWVPDGGQCNGRKWPIMFAGIMLDYAPMKNIGQKSGDYLYSGDWPASVPSDYIHFAEDGQTFYVTQDDVDITGRPFNGGYSQGCNTGTQWCPDDRFHTPYPYTSDMIGMPEWGIRHSEQPFASDSSWLAMYRRLSDTGPSAWVGTTIAARLMNAKGLWNNNAHFDYVDRYVALREGNPDPFGFTVPGETSGGGSTELITAMFDTYRNYSPGTKYKLKSITQDQQ